jgi:hypothetical protein
MRSQFILIPVAVLTLVTCCPLLAQTPEHNDWYWNSRVDLHIDNHSSHVGQGHSVEALTEMLRGIPVSMIQVSALGNGGTHTTYPSKILASSAPGDFDTPGVWKQVAKNLDRKFCIYMNSLGLQVWKEHPEWMRRRADGQGYPQRGGFRMCVKACPDGAGFLEGRLLPLVEEVVARYQPDGIWMDGDWSINNDVCWCDRCQKAWKQKTGKDVVPTSPADAGWTAWLRFHFDRCYEYRKMVADTIHRLCPACMYTSNGGWRIRSTKDDPRSAPDYVGTLSHDLSTYDAMKYTRLYAMALSPEEETPHNIMHFINPGDDLINFARLRQEGSLVMASGSAWFIWTGGTSIVTPSALERATACGDFVAQRSSALGKSRSLNTVAVLASETSWERRVMDAQSECYLPMAIETTALALQDAHFDVDLVNEHILRGRHSHYRVVVVPDSQCEILPETLDSLKDFVRAGGKLVVLGSALQRVEGRDKPRAALQNLQGDEQRQGDVAFAAVDGIVYPDANGTIASVVKRLGVTPRTEVLAGGDDKHLVFSFRGKPGRWCFHVTNLTTCINGQRVPTNVKDNAIDDVAPIPTLRLRLELPHRPDRVTAFPETTGVSHSWNAGRLDLTLTKLDYHAVVEIVVAGEGVE